MTTLETRRAAPHGTALLQNHSLARRQSNQTQTSTALEDTTQPRQSNSLRLHYALVGSVVQRKLRKALWKILFTGPGFDRVTLG
jgi:hypothetical protein